MDKSREVVVFGKRVTTIYGGVVLEPVEMWKGLKTRFCCGKSVDYFSGIFPQGGKSRSDGTSPTSGAKRGLHPHIFWSAGFIHKIYIPYYDYESWIY